VSAANIFTIRSHHSSDIWPPEVIRPPLLPRHPVKAPQEQVPLVAGEGAAQFYHATFLVHRLEGPGCRGACRSACPPARQWPSASASARRRSNSASNSTFGRLLAAPAGPRVRRIAIGAPGLHELKAPGVTGPLPASARCRPPACPEPRR
jgi:hypothetical protein